MKKYDCTVGDKRGEFGLCMERSKEGKFITTEDHEKVVKELENQIKNLKGKLKNKSGG